MTMRGTLVVNSLPVRENTRYDTAGKDAMSLKWHFLFFSTNCFASRNDLIYARNLFQGFTCSLPNKIIIVKESAFDFFPSVSVVTQSGLFSRGAGRSGIQIQPGLASQCEQMVLFIFRAQRIDYRCRDLMISRELSLLTETALNCF